MLEWERKESIVILELNYKTDRVDTTYGLKKKSVRRGFTGGQGMQVNGSIEKHVHEIIDPNIDQQLPQKLL